MSVAAAVAVPFLASTVVLAGAGAAKLYRPEYTARALDAAGLPAHRNLVRLGAFVELALAVAAVAWPGPATGAVVAAAYAGFTLFVVAAIRLGWSLSSCGCFGRPDSRPGWAHAALDAAAAATAALWAAGGGVHVGRLFGGSAPWGGFPLALLTCVVAGLAYLVWNNPLDQAAA